MLISLHLPKTGGSSFLTALEKYYGTRLLKDYADLPINTPVLNRHGNALLKCIRNGFQEYEKIECIHGHFLPLKYLLYAVRNKRVKFITWMRHPVERLASNYYYWIRNYNPENAHPLQRRVVQENWSLERFCLGGELRNFYSQYLWGFPLRRFDFIGITEYYESEMEYFSKQFLGIPLKAYKRNINPRNEKTSYFENEPSLREKIAMYHSKDMALYKEALEMRRRQRAAGGEETSS